MTEKPISNLDRGRLAYDLAHNAEFRRQLKLARYAKQAEAALEEQGAEREAARLAREAEREQRQRRGGTVAAGRARYDETHAKKQTPSDDEGHDPLGPAGDGRERINDTERTGYQGMRAGKARYDQTHKENGVHRSATAADGFEE